MKKVIEVEIKAENEADAADMLELIAGQIRQHGFKKAPSDLQELESDDGARTMGFRYDVSDNADRTDMYGNPLP